MQLGLVNFFNRAGEKVFNVQSRTKQKITFGDLLETAGVQFNPETQTLFVNVDGALNEVELAENPLRGEVAVLMSKIPEDVDQLTEIMAST